MRIPGPQPLPYGQPPWRRVLVVGLAGALIGLILVSLQLVRLGGDPTAPFFVGTVWEFDDALAERGIQVRTVPGTGYDGQWFLGLAGGLLGAPVGVLVAGILAVGVGAAATGRLAAAAGLPRWGGLAFCLVPGVAVG